MARSLKRSIGFASFGAPFLLVVALAACGGDDESSLGTEVEIKPSSFVTTPSTTPAPTAAAGEAPTGEPGETTPGTQVHVVQPGEFLSGIAADYEVDMEEIADFNTWADGVNHPLFPDDQVRIPPGGVIPSPEDEDSDEETESTDEDSDSGDEDETETTEEDDEPELCPDGEPRGRYTVKAGDFPASVAAALDVTLEQLNEANANTPGYSGFIVGIRINIPCGAESTETTEG
jgi:LysM repeat protein